MHVVETVLYVRYFSRNRTYMYIYTVSYVFIASQSLQPVEGPSVSQAVESFSMPVEDTPVK